jgi:hypothetical protein
MNSTKKKECLARKVLMIRPTNFATNYETLLDNKFMTESKEEDVQEKALEEFNNFATNLNNYCEVLVYDQLHKEAVDSVFPNNWFSTHKDDSIPEGLMILYPMKAPTRRKERNPQIIEDLKKNYAHFEDLSHLEDSNEILESTGSLIIDVKHRKIYCSLSERATPKALEEFLNIINKYSKNKYKTVTFRATDQNGSSIYHTNVMMTVLENDIVICLDSIGDKEERALVEKEIYDNYDKDNVININFEEMNNFGCNIISVRGRSGESILILSETSFKVIGEKLHGRYIMCINPINTIEKIGGGSARCMVAEIF